MESITVFITHPFFSNGFSGRELSTAMATPLLSTEIILRNKCECFEGNSYMNFFRLTLLSFDFSLFKLMLLRHTHLWITTRTYLEWKGKHMHNHVLDLNFDSDVFVLNTFISLFSVCLKMTNACMVFDVSFVLDSVSKLGNIID